MPLSSEYKTFVLDLFEPVFPVRVRAMFGGAGIYSGDVMFGLIADERIYLKTDETGKAAFLDEGCGAFVFEPRTGKPVEMSYWEMPERLYDDPDELKAWALKALDVAMKAKAAKPKPRKKRS